MGIHGIIEGVEDIFEPRRRRPGAAQRPDAASTTSASRSRVAAATGIPVSLLMLAALFFISHATEYFESPWK